MKICPKCQQQFPSGFQYCPNDTEHLISQEDLNRWMRPIDAAPVVKSVEPPTSEVVPLSNPLPSDVSPRVPPSPDVPPPQSFQTRQATPQTPQQPRTGQLQSGHPPMGQTQMGQAGNTRNPQIRAPQQTIGPIRAASVIPSTVGSLSFTVPDQGGFLTRLIDGLKNIGESFRGGGKIGRSGSGDLKFRDRSC